MNRIMKYFKENAKYFQPFKNELKTKKLRFTIGAFYAFLVRKDILFFSF